MNKLTFFIILCSFITTSFVSFACSNNYTQPGTYILSLLRDDNKIKDIDKFLNQLSIGNKDLSVRMLIDQFAELSTRAQILEFEKYIRKSVVRQFEHRLLIDDPDAIKHARETYQTSLSVLYKVMFAYKKQLLKPFSKVYELIPGEEFYYIYDSYRSDQMITLFFSSPDGLSEKTPYVFEPGLVNKRCGVIRRFDNPDMNFRIERVLHSSWKGSQYQLFRFRLLKSN